MQGIVIRITLKVNKASIKEKKQTKKQSVEFEKVDEGVSITPCCAFNGDKTNSRSVLT